MTTASNQEPRDGWETESASSYSEEKLYSSWGMEGGSSVNINAKIPNVLKRKIDEMIASGKTGYGTFSDVVRDALYHRSHWWSLNPELILLGLGDPLAFLRRFAARSYKQHIMIQFDKTLQEEIQNVRELRARGLGELAREELLEVYKDCCTVDEPYQTYFSHQLETEFGISQEDLLEL